MHRYAPDLEKFPDFLKAIPIEFVLEEGETVFIPRKWPHYAVAVGLYKLKSATIVSF